MFEFEFLPYHVARDESAHAVPSYGETNDTTASHRDMIAFGDDLEQKKRLLVTVTFNEGFTHLARNSSCTPFNSIHGLKSRI